jgi:inosine/xanthosine triphosphate pyrophosphatase family protein
MENTSWNNRVRNEEVLHRRKEKNILHAIKTRKATWICHIVHSNCLLKHIIEGKIEGGMKVKERQRRKCKQLLDDLKEKR